jgi:hypothetical protein
MRDERDKLVELIRNELGEDLRLPPLPGRLGGFFEGEAGGSYLYGSQVALGQKHPYLDQRDAGLFLEQAPIRYVMVGFWGHGVNSYAFYYCCSDPSVKVFLRIPYGGAYMGEAERARLVAFFENFTPFLQMVRPLILSMQLVESMGSSYRRIVTKSGKTIEEEEPSLHLNPDYCQRLLERLSEDVSAVTTWSRGRRTVTDRELSFHDQMKKRQEDWRTDTLPGIAEWGDWNGRTYPHILPRDQWQMNLWPEIREAILGYLVDNPVKAHEGKHNLLSSWVLGASLYFPFGQSAEARDLLAGFLRAKVDPRIRTVHEVSLEFEDDEPLTTGSLLGEKDGGRGFNQTSPDVGVRVELQGGQEGLVLIEVKFCEKSFSSCSARRKELVPRGRQGECDDLAYVVSNSSSRCAQHYRYQRRYFDYLAPVLTGNGFAGRTRCPAAINGYQLFRQQALSEALAASGQYGLVASCLAYHRDNTVLAGCLKGIRVLDLSGWGELFLGESPFVAFTHQDFVSYVRFASQASRWTSWLEWADARYDLR